MSRPKFERIVTIYGSDTVHAVAYDPLTEVLDVKFASREMYRYRGVSAEDFSLLVTSRSAGKVFNERIKRYMNTDSGYATVTRKATKLRRPHLLT